MEQIEMLLDFQEADMEADALEMEIRRSPNRIALKKNLDFLREQQEVVKHMEEQITTMLDRVDVIKEAIHLQEEQLKALQKRVTDTPPESLEDTKAMQSDAQRLLHDIHGYETEMKRIQKEAADNERRHKEIVIKYAKVKAEYDHQKVDYEAEYTEQMKALEEKRKIAQEKAKGIDQKLMGSLPGDQKAFHTACGKAHQRAVRRLLHGPAFRNAAEFEGRLGHYRV